MKKLFYCLCFMAVSVISARAAQGQDAATEPFRKFALIGDSQGANLKRELWVKAAEAGCRFDSKTEIGTRAVGWIDSGRMRAWLKEYDPDVVLVSFGTNEAKYGTPVATLAQQFQTFVGRVSDHGRRRVIWIAPPNLQGVDYLVNVRAALATVKGIEVADLSENGYAMNDSEIHLTRAAYVSWAWDIWTWIRTHPTLTVAKR